MTCTLQHSKAVLSLLGEVNLVFWGEIGYALRNQRETSLEICLTLKYIAPSFEATCIDYF